MALILQFSFQASYNLVRELRARSKAEQTEPKDVRLTRKPKLSPAQKDKHVKSFLILCCNKIDWKLSKIECKDIKITNNANLNASICPYALFTLRVTLPS